MPPRLAANPESAGRDTRSQLQFLGEENLKNRSAVENLMRMGQSGKAHYVNAGMTLHNLLPGVKITALGPPTLEQSNSIRKERTRSPRILAILQFLGVSPPGIDGNGRTLQKRHRTAAGRPLVHPAGAAYSSGLDAGARLRVGYGPE